MSIGREERSLYRREREGRFVDKRKRRREGRFVYRREREERFVLKDVQLGLS